MTSILNMINSWFNGQNPVIGAILLLLLAWIIAAIVRAVVKSILEKVYTKRLSNAPEVVANEKASTIALLGNIAFAVVFMLFLPGALQQLGVSSVSQPISNVASTFLSYLPNVIAAGLIVVFGIFLARLVRQLLSLALKKTKLDALQERVGIDVTNGTGLSDILSLLAYAVILVVFVIAALEVLNIKAISEPATDMVKQLFNYVPSLFAAIVMVAFGVFLANLVSQLLENVLKGTGLDNSVKSLLPTNEKGSVNYSASSLIAKVVKVVINILFVVSAINIMNIDVLTNVGKTIIAYLPNVLGALIIVVLAWILATKAQELVVKANPNSAGLGFIAKIAILVIAAFMAVNQLGIAKDIVNTIFTYGTIALAAALGLSFGLGGREWAAKKLEKMDTNIENQLNKKK